jgi:hypothetical protein
MGVVFQARDPRLDGSSYEIHAPFDVWDGHVDGERRCSRVGRRSKETDRHRVLLPR